MVDGKKMRRLRENLGLSQQELGEAAGVSVQMISYLEAEIKTANVDTIARIARKLDVKLDDIVVLP